MEQYEKFRECGWKSHEDCAKVISFFRKRKKGEEPVSGKVQTPVQARKTQYNKSYDTQLVIRLMRDKMFLKKRTRCSDGVKRRLTPRKDFLSMKPYEEYIWISLQEEVRYAVRNNIESILLSREECKILE